MQLPQNKQDRQKILALIGVGVVAVLYGIWAGIYNPIVTKKADAITRITELEDNIEKAERQIRRLPLVERELWTVTTNLAAYSETHLLYPRLGNYLLPVREWVGQQALDLGIENLQVDEIGLFGLPKGPQSPANPAMQLFGARVAASCGYETLRHWFSIMEEQNPFIAVGNVMITARPDDPLHHQVSFELHFPVWTDAGYDEQLQDDLAALEAEAK